MSNEIVVQKSDVITSSPAYEMVPVEQIKQQTEQVKTLMATCMDESVHFGKIPGCGDKPTLLQPGAQQLTLMFGLADTYETEEKDLPNGHREYTVKCMLVSKSTGLVQGSGMGLCSTMESKYRYRNVSDYEVTGEPIPQDARDRKQEYRKQGFGMKKIDGAWEWVRYTDSQKQENPDIADTYNTVLKMACKRALIAATLNTLAVSSLFTQDLEDLSNYEIVDRKPEDPRKALWSEAGALKRQALDLGVSEDGIQAWMDAHIIDQFGVPKRKKDYSADDISWLVEYLQDVIKGAKELNEQPVDYPDDELFPEDVVF